MNLDELKSKNSTKAIFNFKGKYSDYLEDLQQQSPVHSKMFDETYKAFVFFVYYGLMKGKKHEFDPKNDGASNPDRMPIGFRFEASNRAGGIFKYDTLRKIVLLSENSDSDFSKKVDNALRFDYPTNNIDDEDLIVKSRYGDNSNLIEQYCYGGLELFYSKVSSISTPEDMIDFMNETMEEFQEISR